MAMVQFTFWPHPVVVFGVVTIPPFPKVGSSFPAWAIIKTDELRRVAHTRAAMRFEIATFFIVFPFRQSGSGWAAVILDLSAAFQLRCLPVRMAGLRALVVSGM
jgi:hypothetical protein